MKLSFFKIAAPLMLLFFLAPSFASASFSVPLSKEGNVTGSRCASDGDCIEGCDFAAGAPLCGVRSEVKSCMGAPGPGGLKCGCLTDIKRCGYRFGAPRERI